MSGVFTIPPTSSFVDALAHYLLCETKSAPEKLATYTVLLPNRRGIKALQDAFLRLTNGQPLMLPLIRAIADVTEEELVLLGVAPDIAPPVKSIRRQIMLAQFLQKAYPDTYTNAQALTTASELARFIDSVHTEGLDLNNLDNLVTGEYAKHWEISLTFLRTILRELWPSILQSEGVMDAAQNRRLMIEAYTQSIINNPPKNPIIAAGSTGSIPATANLLRAVAHTQNGTVILPGLDTVLDDASWEKIEEGHPQAVMKNLLSHIGITRGEVETLPHTQTHIPRMKFISEIMRPSATVGAWVNNTALDATSIQNLHLLEAETLDGEATAIALMMREHAEFNKDQTMLLITPDRLLANRVTLMLRRWGIVIDDSAGTPLSQTDKGSYLLLLAQTLAEKMAPIPLLGLLKHDICAGGGNIPNWRNFVRKLEQKILRGIRPASLLIRARDDMRDDIQTLTDIFDTALNADDKLTTFITLAQTLATAPEKDGNDRLWSGESGDAAAKFFGSLLEQTDVIPHDITWSDFYDLLLTTMPSATVRPRYGTHPRLAILGAMEARLYQADIMILGSLNENTWPPAAKVDGWLSRPMRAQYGLPSPERAITLSAHDFCQGLGAPTVYLTRAKLRDGTPTTPSRWLQRLDAVLRATNLPDISNTTPYLNWASRLDMPTASALTPATRPTATPPITARPKTLSVTDIVNLQKDPYGIYAKYTLKLRQWNPLDAEPGPSERGTLIHAALEKFNRQYPRELPDNALDKLISIGRETFDNAGDHPDIIGHWWPRFERMANAFIKYETTWRTDTKEIFTEVKSTLTIPAGELDGEHEIALTGRADRIELRLGNEWSIIDYKSGTPPTVKNVTSGIEPQLTLLGAMLQNNAFNTALKLQSSKHTITSLAYWPVSGSKDVLYPTLIQEDADTLCNTALENLTALLTEYMQGKPYESWPDATSKRPDYYPYTHFERVLEWHTNDDGEEEAA